MKVGNYSIGIKNPPFVVAELSGNHNQSLDTALKLVEKAAEAGANAIKLQTYKPETITLDLNTGEFFVVEDKSLWKGRSLFELYQIAMTPWEWHEAIFNRCKQLGLIFFSSPFDETAVDFLEKLCVPCYKIASQELVHLPLLRKVARTGKPVIMSCGMATFLEIDESVRTLRENGCSEIALLKCTSNYPASPDNSNLLTIPAMREKFNVEVGLSDHTLGIGAAVCSIGLGATIIEKHLVLSRASGGVDSAFSLEPGEFAQLTHETKQAWLALGSIQDGPTTAEIPSLKYRRSIYIKADVKAGDIASEANLQVVRPSLGLQPKFWDSILGMKFKVDAKKGTPLTFDLLIE